MNAIEAAIAKAKESQAAAALAATDAGLPASIPTTGTAVGAATAPVRKLTMDDVQPNLAVDGFIKADLRGIVVDENTIVESITVEVTLAEVQATRMIKWAVDNVPKYARSYDGVTESGTGRPWASVLEKAQSVDPRVKADYPSCEIPMKLLDAVKNKKGEVVWDEGNSLGYSTSTTGHPLFMKAFNAAKAAGQSTMVVKVTSASRKNKKIGSEYAVLEWELLSQ